MRNIILRLLDLKLPRGKSAFLWGPRKCGKSYWIRHHLNDALLIDLLKTDTFAEYASRPALLRERHGEEKRIIVLDEVQKIPALLDEVHWLIENRRCSFLLTGSSARKLKRGHANLLGGRAWKRHMTPLTSREVSAFDPVKVVLSGLLPPHYLSETPEEELRAYVSDYLKEEIAAEALTQNIPAFSEFLRVAALTNGELLNYANVAREVGVSPKILRTYFDILEDTYLGFRVPPWRKSKNRRLIETEKFYLFDVGVSNYLARRKPAFGTPEFGKSFEQLILMELKAYQAYRDPEMTISFWRTSTGYEVDFIVNDKALAIELKASRRVHEADLRPMFALLEDGQVRRAVVVSFEAEPRKISGVVEILPWRRFLDALWDGELTATA